MKIREKSIWAWGVAAAVAAFAVGCGSREQADARLPERKIYAHFMGCWPASYDDIPKAFRRVADRTPAERFERARRIGNDAVGGRVVNWPLQPQDYQTDAISNAKREIARAIRAGIDGFAFDAWAGGVGAMKQFDVFIRAAEEMKADFGITICIDPSCLGDMPGETRLDKYVAAMKYVLRHRDSPNLGRFHGKPLLFGYFSNGIDKSPNGATIPERLERERVAWAKFRERVGEPVFIHGSMDSFALLKDVDWTLVGTEAAKIYDAVGGWLGEENAWGFNTNYVAAVRAAGADWCQPMFSQYSNKGFGLNTDAGLNHLRRNWDAAIRNDSHLLQFVTWNDYGEESCMSPTYGNAYTVTRVNRHFAEKWKTGREPKVGKDEVHAVFRRAVSTEDPYPFLSRRTKRPAALEIDLFLTAPAKVEVAGYGAFDAPAGYSFKQFPLKEGAIRVAVRRGGEKVIDWTCPETVAANSWREDMTLAAYGTNYEEEWKTDFPDKPLFVYTENADDDGDGMPNWYEMIYFGNFPRMSTATAGDPDGDPDGDGRTNLQEFRDRTNPLVADKAGYGAGYVWRLGDLKDEPFVTNPFKDAKGHARWHAAYKFGPTGKIARDGGYTVMDWRISFAQHRDAGVYVKNPYGPSTGHVAVGTNGVVTVRAQRECLMALGFRAPEDGVYAADARVVGCAGRGVTCVALARGAAELAAQEVAPDQAVTLAAQEVALKKGETLWLVFDAAKSVGMRGVRIERWDVTRVR